MKGNYVKRFFAVLGILPFGWLVLSLGYFMVFGFNCFLQEPEIGKDSLTSAVVCFFRLPVWIMSVVILLAAYSLIYLSVNKPIIKRQFNRLSDCLFGKPKESLLRD